MEQQIINIIAREIGIDPAGIQPHQHLVDDLGADSLEICCIEIEIAERLGIDVDGDVLETWQTVQDVLNCANTDNRSD